MHDTVTERWVGDQPSLAQIAANLCVGICGILITGMQPLLLGTLELEGRISAAQIGEAATAELLMMGIASAYAGARWRAEGLRFIAIASALALGGLDLLTTRVSGSGITLVRALAGVPSGVMIWITIAMIARSPMPERWSGAYLTSQTLIQFLLATGMTVWVVSSYGANGGFVVLAVICAITALLATQLADRLAPLAEETATNNMPPPQGWPALAACFLYSAFIFGVWVYVESMSRQHGHEASVAGLAVSISLACQVIGGMAATAFAGRLRWFPTLMVVSVANALCIVGFLWGASPAIFLLTAGLFGGLWLFAVPFLMPMVIAADPSRRSAVLIGGAQLLGGSLGPLFASFIVSDVDVRGALLFGAAALVLSVVLIVVLRSRRAKLSAAM